MIRDEITQEIIRKETKVSYSIDDLIEKRLKGKNNDPNEPGYWKITTPNIEGIEDEDWLINPTYKHPKYEVSNYGRVSLIKEQGKEREILKQIDSNSKGWLVLEIHHTLRIYTLVAETWLVKPNIEKLEIHHIENNGYDNRAINLIYVTEEEHGKIPK